MSISGQPIRGYTVGSLVMTRSKVTRTVYPLCPVCHRTMRLLHGWDEWERRQPGQPHVWWCPEDATVLRRSHGRWYRQEITPDGDLVTVEEVHEVHVHEALS